MFRIYRFYTDKMKEKQIPLFYTSAISALLIGFNIFTVYAALDYFEIITMFSSKYYMLLFGGILWLLNHYLFVQHKKFLEYNFRKDFLGGILIVLYIILTGALFIWVANLNRAKIFNEAARTLNENVHHSTMEIHHSRIATMTKTRIKDTDTYDEKRF